MPEDIPLHAERDHVVVRGLLPEIAEDDSFLMSSKNAAELISSDVFWVPVAIDPVAQRIYFVYIGDDPMDSWQAIYSIAKVIQGDPRPAFFSAPFSLLQELDFHPESAMPKD